MNVTRDNERSLVTSREIKNVDRMKRERPKSEDGGESDSSLENQPREERWRRSAGNDPSDAYRPTQRRNRSDGNENAVAPCVRSARIDDKDVPRTETAPESRRSDGDRYSKTKKKKKRRFLTICTSNCKYEVVRRVAGRYGMKEVTEDSSWNLYWTDLSVSIERAKDMKRFQKINHFPGMTEICRKDLLARNLNRMLRLFPAEYNFFPKTWCFPADHGEAIAYAKLRRAKTFIIKPDMGCQGRGIYLTKNLKDVKPYERMICQVYVARPYLIDGFKFDLRIYALITSCDPLRIYVYNDGLTRFATSRYKEPTGHNTSNVFMHLTNYAVNKHSRMYVVDDEAGSKRKISTLNKWLKTNGVDTDNLWRRIDEIIIKTVLAAHPMLKHSYHTCFPTHDTTYACFELLGFDVLLDAKLKPYLLEVNHSPSFHTDAQIDKEVKESLLTDTFEMLNLNQCDKRKMIDEDRKRVRERLLQGIHFKDVSSNDASANLTKFDKAEDDSMHRQHAWEETHMGNFRRIYPAAGTEKYDPFFKQNGSSMFQDTAASRAREEAVKVQREETETRIKEQDAKRMTGKWSDQKLNPESPNGLRRSGLSARPEKSKGVASLRKHALPPMPLAPRSAPNVSFSFEPEIICESEERERVTSLAQRDFLIKSYGMPEQIYLAMKRNDILRPEDEKKYGLYSKLGYTNKSQRSCQNIPCHLHTRGAILVDQNMEYILNSSNYQIARQERDIESRNKCLKITCNEAPLYIRPNIPQKFWIQELNSSDRDARITKTHVARTLSNAARLHAVRNREDPNFSNFATKQIARNVNWQRNLRSDASCVRLHLCPQE